jgi:hypothetical protein
MNYTVNVAVFIIVILLIAHTSSAQYADCTGTSAEPCEVCDISEIEMFLVSLSDVMSSSYNMTLDAPGGCIAPYEFIYDIGYTYCPEEGQYSGTFNITFSDDSKENFGPLALYGFDVEFDDLEEWCECGYGTAKWTLGGVDCDPVLEGIQSVCCCGDDIDEYNQTCQDGVLDVCDQSIDNEACCPSPDSCVYDGVCYLDQDVLSGTGKCLSGVWTDSNGPTVSDDYPYSGTWVNGQHDITVTANDGESGIGNVNYCFGDACQLDSTTDGLAVSGPPYIISISGDIEDTLRYRAWDSIGNPSLIGELQIRLDNSDPETVCSNCPAAEIGNGRDIDLSPSDSLSSVASTRFCIASSPATCDPVGVDGQEYNDVLKIPVGFSCPVAQTCQYELRYYSVDITGNQEDTKSNTINVNKLLPWCNFVSLPTYTTNSQISLQWDGADPGGDPLDKFEIRFRTGGSPTWSSVGDYPATTKSTTFDASAFGDGDYEFSCVLKTVPGEQSEPDTATTVLDTLEPSITFSLAQYTIQENFDITWSASDSGSGLDRFEIYVDSVMWKEVPGTTTTETYSGAVGQAYSIMIKTYDLAGNSRDSTAQTITIDNQAPGCSLPSLPGFVNSTIFPLSWSSISGDVESYAVCINNDGAQCTIPTSGWGDADLGSTTFRDFIGTHGISYHFRCRATDMAGNIGDWSSSVSTTVDSRPPEIDEQYSTEVVAGDVYEPIIVNVTVTDEFGIKDVDLTIKGSSFPPESKSGSTGDVEWILSWEIPYATYAGETSFTISTEDMNNNVEIDLFNYSILDCSPGQVRTCDPRDPLTDQLYDQGLCRHTGNITCGVDGEWGTCSGGIMPVTETCNNKDDDCDGETDEGLDRKECGFNNVGICRMGFQDCVNGELTDCAGARLPDDELCGNSWDDDCDGSVDENCECDEGQTQPCGQSNAGICQLGTQTCRAGAWGNCDGAIMPQTEVCDTLDNDCDG